MELGQISTAMVTPFSESGEIDYDRTDVIIEHLIKSGTDSLVVCGTTGEAPTMSTKEQLEFIEYTIRKVNKRIPVIASTGSNATVEAIERTKRATQSGADGIMLVSPYYNRPDQKGLYMHFSSVAAETKLPVLLYNIPGRSVVNMLPETVIALSKIKNIRAMKEASGDLDQIADIIAGTDEEFAVYSGDDGMTLPILAIGGNGVVSVASHIVGNEMQTMINSFKAGKLAEAAAMHRTLLPLFRALFSAPSPAPLKYALRKNGLDVGSVRLPLVGFNEHNSEFDQAWERFGKQRHMFD